MSLPEKDFIDKEDLFYINENSLSKELCEEIINLYELEGNMRAKGETARGYNPNIKDSLDFIINNHTYNEKWNTIYKTLQVEVSRNLQRYIEKNSFKKHIIISGSLFYETFMIQRYTKGEGKYIYHEDFSVNYNEKSYRVLTYLWYLNDVEEGGETEFFGNMKVKPRAGKLILFPASWTYPHSGLVPISSDKYIVTGWIFLDNNKSMSR
jgi:predicted 2-oxoglutarate/Fe(II)-dependent dioxygenase YbiX